MRTRSENEIVMAAHSNRTLRFCYSVARRSPRHASTNEASGCLTRKFVRGFSPNSSTRPKQTTHALRRRLCTPRHAVALGVSARHQRIPAEDDARQLRVVREVSALQLQLQRRESLSHDEGILARRLRAREAVRGRGTLVSGGLVDGRKRRELGVGRIDLSPDSLRQQILSARVWQDECGVHAARLFRVSGFAAEHPGPRGDKRILNSEAHVELGGARRRTRLDRRNAAWYSVQRGRSEEHTS